MSELAEQIATETDKATEEHLKAREPEVVTEESLNFADGEVTTRSKLEAVPTEVEQKPKEKEEPKDKKEPERLTPTDRRIKKLEERAEQNQQRINKAYGDMREMQRRAEEAEKQREKMRQQLEEKIKAVEPDVGPRPKFDDFETPDEWIVAVDEWKEKKNARSKPAAEVVPKPTESKKEEPVEPEPELTPEQKAAGLKAQAMEGRGQETYDDYVEVVSNRDLKISVEMVDAIYDSDNDVEVAYYLGKNPAESARICGLSPEMVPAEIKKLSKRLIKESTGIGEEPPPEEPPKEKEPAPKKKAEISKAPPPIEPLSGTEQFSVNAENLTQKQYEELRRSGKL